jgi:hypothetical protein
LTIWNFSYVTFVQPHKQKRFRLSHILFSCFCLHSRSYTGVTYDRMSELRRQLEVVNSQQRNYSINFGN